MEESKSESLDKLTRKSQTQKDSKLNVISLMRSGSDMYNTLDTNIQQAWGIANLNTRNAGSKMSLLTEGKYEELWKDPPTMPYKTEIKIAR